MGYLNYLKDVIKENHFTGAKLNHLTLLTVETNKSIHTQNTGFKVKYSPCSSFNVYGNYKPTYQYRYTD